MYWRERRLLCALLLLGFLAAGRAQMQYILTTPAALSSGETGRACVNIAGNTEKLDVQLLMQHNGKNTTIIEQDVSEASYFQCGDYPIPKEEKGTPITLLLNAKGQTTEILERKTVAIKPTSNSCIYQMDKPIYKPGQKVRARIVCLDSQFKAVNEEFPNVYLQDPTRTRIKQLRNQKTDRGVLPLEFDLIPEAPTGSYSIIAERKSSYSLSNWFSVQEYVPPRFSIKADVPDTISALQDTLKVSVSASYAYGESVPGAVVVRYCKQPNVYGRRRNCLKEKEDLCSNMTGKLDAKGEYKGEIDMSGQSSGLSGMSIQVQFTVIEDGTGIQVSESRYVWVTLQPARLSFDYSALKQHYKRGIGYNIVAQLTDEQNNPLPNEDIDIEKDNNLIGTVKTDSKGTVQYELDTSDIVAPNFTLRVSYRNSEQCYYADWRETDYPTVEYTAHRFYSKTGSFLQGTSPKDDLSVGKSYDIRVQYVFSQDAVGEGKTTVPLFYLIMSGSKIVHNGQQDVDLTSSMNGSTSINIPVSAKMAPTAKVILYSILKGEVIVDSFTMGIEKKFENSVDMKFAAEKTTPGSTAEVILTADPNSICGVKVIDSTLLLLNSYERFTADSIFGMFSTYFYGYNVAGIDLEDPEPQCIDPTKLVYFNGYNYLPVSIDSEGDSYENLKDAGLFFVTKEQVRKPKVCDNNPSKFQRPGGVGGIVAESQDAPMSMSLKSDARGFGGGDASPVVTVRSNFKENMMWLMVPLDKDGHASISELTPDTITKWIGSAFCLADKGGFGMTTHSAELTTTLPLFVEVTMPYSVIRGETMLLTAVVNNYLEKSAKVNTELGSSADFQAVQKEGTKDACVSPNNRITSSWEVMANKLGNIEFSVTGSTSFIGDGDSCEGPSDSLQPARSDTVKKSLKVEPEGIKVQQTLSTLIFAKPGVKSSVPIKINLPDNLVPDSASAHVTAVGDIFGLPWKNIQDLVDMPYGCAEPNLARVIPVVYALRYLNSTGQLTDEDLQKGKQYLAAGYARLLGYASGAAYKWFRTSPKPDLYLTAHSFAAFELAKPYIDIDETRQQNTLVWMESQQRLENGCFKAQGMPILQDEGSDLDLQYTAYVAHALLKSEYSLAKTLVNGAMECLKNASTTQQQTSTEILMLYAFKLAGLTEYSAPLMEKLLKKGKAIGGTMHWERDNMPNLRPVPFFLPIYAPADIELTGLMLSCMTHGLNKATISAAGAKKKKRTVAPAVAANTLMEKIAQTSVWLSQNQNPNGGFRSTRDTITSLQALSEVATLFYTPNSHHEITVIGNNEKIGTMSLKQDNRLEVLRQTLPDARGEYSAEYEGTGWALVQTNVEYNVPVPTENSVFSLSASSASENCLQGVAKTINLTITVSYRGVNKASKMAIIDSSMLSGYTYDYWSLKELENANVISKFEDNKEGGVNIYLNSVGQDPITFSFRVNIGNRVLNVQKSSMRVSEYDNPDANGYASYPHPCNQAN